MSLEKINIFQKRLAVETAIAEYLDLWQVSNRKLGAAKGKITKLASELAGEMGATAARERIFGFLESIEIQSERLDLLRKRFDPKSFYEEGEKIFGWWDGENQVQAQELPLVKSNGYWVNWDFCRKDTSIWRARGFEVPVSFPVESLEEGSIVKFDVKRSLDFIEHGYALPCELQWHRGYWDDGGTCLWVDRSIISVGFWQAWKWWDTAKWWYLEKRPELFADLDWWSNELPPRRFEPEDDPYAVVLGGQ